MEDGGIMAEALNGYSGRLLSNRVVKRKGNPIEGKARVAAGREYEEGVR